MREKLRNIRPHALSASRVDAARQHVRIGKLPPLLSDRRELSAFGKLVQLRIKRLQLRNKPTGGLIYIANVEAAENKAFVFIPCGRGLFADLCRIIFEWQSRHFLG